MKEPRVLELVGIHKRFGRITALSGRWQVHVAAHCDGSHPTRRGGGSISRTAPSCSCWTNRRRGSPDGSLSFWIPDDQSIHDILHYQFEIVWLYEGAPVHYADEWQQTQVPK